MALVSLANLTNGTLADANALMGNLNAIAAQVNGHLDNANLDPALLAQVGASDPNNPRSGWAVMAGTDARTNAAYGLMATPDRVSGIVLPNGGLIEVTYQALWQETTPQNGRAAIFLGSNQLQMAQINGSPTISEAYISTATPPNTDAALASFPLGLVSAAGVSSGEALTGQAIGVTSGVYFPGSGQSNVAGAGGPCVLFLSPGTYDVSVRFKAIAGTVTVKTRRLFVKAYAF